jgi:dTDP-4-dehydrorhamnose 3,5-epimerase
MLIKDLKNFEGIELYEKITFESELGFFVDTYNSQLHEYKFVKDSISGSIKPGTIRGFHFQIEPFAQAKLISVIQGSIIDFFVDIRHDSKTYLDHGKVKLSNNNSHFIYLPKGFAHGFITLESNTIVSYKLDEHYNPEFEKTILWDDPNLGVEWPEFEDYFLSSKDKQGLSLNEFKALNDKESQN